MIMPEPESGMQFNFQIDENYFFIEEWVKSQSLKSVKSVEYAYFDKKNRLLLIEAKSSSPRPVLDGNNEKYETFITEIIEKITHSIDMLFAALIGYRKAQIPDTYKNSDYSKINLLVLIVIKGHKPSWTLPIQVDLKQRLRSHLSIWRMDIKVINDEEALNYNLIQGVVTS